MMANIRQNVVDVLALGLIRAVSKEWRNNEIEREKVSKAHSEISNDDDVDLFNFHCDMNDRQDLVISV